MDPRGPDPERVDEALAEARRALEPHAERLRTVGVAGIVGSLVLGRFRRSARRLRPRGRLLRRFGFGLVIVVLSVATCSFGVDTAALTSEWGEPVPASTADAARVLTRGAEVLQGAPESRRVRLVVTEAEATSALSLGLMMSDLMQAAGRIPQEEVRSATDLEALRERVWAEAEAQRRELARRSGWAERVLLRIDPKIRTGDVQVRFEPSGEVVVAGYVQAWRFRQPGLFVFAPSASAGDVDLDFVSGRLGRLPLPEVIFDWIGGMVVRGILLGREWGEISEITVADGTLTFAARASPQSRP